jgi:hypothetical protein
MTTTVQRILCLAAALFLPGLSGVQATLVGDGRVETSATGIAGRKESQYGKGLARRLNYAACFAGSPEFIASWQGRRFSAPCRFIHETISHLRAVSQISTRLVFPLHNDHVHLAVPSDLWEEKYHAFSNDEILSAVLRESRLVAVYHANDSLVFADSETTTEPHRRRTSTDRQVLGYYDGRGIEVLPSHLNALAKRYRSVAWFYFQPRASDGITAFFSGEGLTFDISFDHELADECSSSRRESRDVRIRTNESIDDARACGELHFWLDR